VRADGAGRVYRLLMRALPATFRRKHGEAMEQSFAVIREAAKRDGWPSLARLHATEGWDLIRTGVALRIHGRRGRASGGVIRQARPRRIALHRALRDELVAACRSTTRHRGFFLFAALTFALGVGATTATFSVLKSVVLEPLPYAGSERWVTAYRTMGTMLLSPSSEEIEALESERSVFDEVATFGWSSEKVWTGGDEPARLESLAMSPELGGFLGVAPVMGRLFAADEFAGDGAHVLLLSHAMWMGQFGGAPDVLGRTLTLNGEPWTVIGVMPPGAVRPNGMPTPIDVWLPLPANARYAEPIARLRPGVTLAEASKVVDALVRRTSKSEAFGGKVRPATAMRESGLGDPLRILMVAVMLLLSIACVNVSNLLVNRASERRRETAVLAALGASRLRLLRQFLMESLLLALAGGVLGVILAEAALRAMIALRPSELITLESVRLDAGVLLFSLIVCTVAGIAVGLLPAFQSAKANAMSALTRAAREGDPGPAGLRWLLVGAEVTLSFTLLVGASLVIRTLHEHTTRDPGYRPRGLMVMHVELPAWTRSADAAKRLAFEQIENAVMRVPGVEEVSRSGGAPARPGIMFGQVHIEGRPKETEASRFYGVSIDEKYLRVTGQPLVAGRTFNEAELGGQGQAAILLGETAARRLFPGGDALGRRFSIGADDEMTTVIGVVRDATLTGLSVDEPIEIAYWPMTSIGSSAYLLVRTRGEDAALGGALRDAVRGIEPQAILDVSRATDQLGLTLARERFTTTLLGAFAGLAMLLAAIGLCSVVNQAVTRRTHEIGIRVSLGATAASIRALVLRAGMIAIAIGLVTGGALAAVALRLSDNLVFGLSNPRPLAWVVAAAVLGATGLLAMWLPVERAARVDPMRAMRSD
jgi:putative ABC transport system permease protein